MTACSLYFGRIKTFESPMHLSDASSSLVLGQPPLFSVTSDFFLRIIAIMGTLSSGEIVGLGESHIVEIKEINTRHYSPEQSRNKAERRL
ncbi:hypothetical protein Cob_v000920 [Colletotrichum orbiculare MAFF 240422]|uniref:Uncharacterized protein n=1 Tax=Colletotrichum orbiculare (strain 104-T / ATCC 96160 / CBS 514.97 / LARS 414 / MAFF 240422) TaxID=1213857 RepID=A0A484G734_COLOR|nr:hypothetical protein Cob_v000920 [Colletotrichum orbiculare MAFF 240422]